jgi:hypothetical protein
MVGPVRVTDDAMPFELAHDAYNHSGMAAAANDNELIHT